MLLELEGLLQELTRFIQDRSLEDYLTDLLLRRAVERTLGMVGETLVQLRKTDPAVFREIKEGNFIIGFRNLLIHAYAQVTDRVVWGILQENIPILHSDVRRLSTRP